MPNSARRNSSSVAGASRSAAQLSHWFNRPRAGGDEQGGSIRRKDGRAGERLVRWREGDDGRQQRAMSVSGGTRSERRFGRPEGQERAARTGARRGRESMSLPMLSVASDDVQVVAKRFSQGRG